MHLGPGGSEGFADVLTEAFQQSSGLFLNNVCRQLWQLALAFIAHKAPLQQAGGSEECQQRCHLIVAEKILSLIITSAVLMQNAHHSCRALEPARGLAYRSAITVVLSGRICG